MELHGSYINYSTLFTWNTYKKFKSITMLYCDNQIKPINFVGNISQRKRSRFLFASIKTFSSIRIRNHILNASHRVYQLYQFLKYFHNGFIFWTKRQNFERIWIFCKWKSLANVEELFVAQKILMILSKRKKERKLNTSTVVQRSHVEWMWIIERCSFFFMRRVSSDVLNGTLPPQTAK